MVSPMADVYPKSRDELSAENNQLKDKIAGLETIAGQLESALRNKEAEIAMLRRRKPPHQLDKDATDVFRRPAYSR